MIKINGKWKRTEEEKENLRIKSTNRKFTSIQKQSVSKGLKLAYKKNPMSEERKHNISEGHKGQLPWNKGKTTIEQQIKYFFRRKTIPFRKLLIQRSLDTIEKLSVSHKGKHCGKDHPNWKGGISWLPYCEKFNNSLKEAIRKRDNYTCQLCGISQKTRKHTVHHIHYDKENCYPDLICLCIKCNSKVNFNRDFWEELFTFMLWVQGMLYWKPI